jgi:plasmid stabilization system protein ParE
MRVRLTVRAQADLDAIRSYLVPRSPQGAERVRQAIEDTFDLLGTFPEIGQPTDIDDIRMLPVVRYCILSITWPRRASLS